MKDLAYYVLLLSIPALLDAELTSEEEINVHAEKCVADPHYATVTEGLVDSYKTYTALPRSERKAPQHEKIRAASAVFQMIMQDPDAVKAVNLYDKPKAAASAKSDSIPTWDVVILKSAFGAADVAFRQHIKYLLTTDTEIARIKAASTGYVDGITTAEKFLETIADWQRGYQVGGEDWAGKNAEGKDRKFKLYLGYRLDLFAVRKAKPAKDAAASNAATSTTTPAPSTVAPPPPPVEGGESGGEPEDDGEHEGGEGTETEATPEA